MTKAEYRKKCIECIPYKDDGVRNQKRLDKFYYENTYAKGIKAYFKKNEVESLEVNYSKRSKTIPICAFLSSGRLCYNYFRNEVKLGNNKSITFEKPIYNDLPIDGNKRKPTKMDAAEPDEGKYYECKCDEILATSHSLLSYTYQECSEKFKDFELDEYVKRFTKTDKKGVEHAYVDFRASDLLDLRPLLNEYPKYKNYRYNEMCFDLKQFICHLIALATSVDGDKELIYVTFVPDKDYLDYYPSMMEKEMQCIKNSPKINKFLDKYHISFSWKFVSIGDVKDINYLETYGKTK